MVPPQCSFILVGAIVMLLATTGVLAACDPHFGGKCTCGPGSYEGRGPNTYIVNCTNTGFTDTAVLSFMPPHTEVLIFTGNRIAELPPNVFGAINDYPQLAVIDMSNNHIREIRGKAYHHVASVELLILNHNNLSIAAGGDELNHHHPRVFSNFFNLRSLHLSNAFADNTSLALSQDLHDIFMNSNLTQLTKLHLEQNEIRHFGDRNVFCDLPALRELYLSDNLLTELDFNLICMQRLHFLNLEGNRFVEVRSKKLTLLDRLVAMPGRTTDLMVDLSRNRFVCDCRLKPLVDWMLQTNVSVRGREGLTCRHRRVRVLNMSVGVSRADDDDDDGDFGADDDERSGYVRTESLLDYEAPACQVLSGRPGSGHVVALAVLLGAFSALLLVLIVSVVYMSRERIRRRCTPMLSAVSKKVQYTTIRNEDQCPEVHV